MPEIVGMIDVVAEEIFRLFLPGKLLPEVIHVGKGAILFPRHRFGRGRIRRHVVRAVMPFRVRREGGKQNDLRPGVGPYPINHRPQIVGKRRWRQAAQIVIVHAEADQNQIGLLREHLLR